MADGDWKSTVLEKLPQIFDIVIALLGVVVVLLAGIQGFKYKDLSIAITDPVIYEN